MFAAQICSRGRLVKTLGFSTSLFSFFLQKKCFSIFFLAQVLMSFVFHVGQVSFWACRCEKCRIHPHASLAAPDLGEEAHLLTGLEDRGGIPSEVSHGYHMVIT